MTWLWIPFCQPLLFSNCFQLPLPPSCFLQQQICFDVWKLFAIEAWRHRRKFQEMTSKGFNLDHVIHCSLLRILQLFIPHNNHRLQDRYQWMPPLIFRQIQHARQFENRKLKWLSDEWNEMVVSLPWHLRVSVKIR